MLIHVATKSESTLPSVAERCDLGSLLLEPWARSVRAVSPCIIFLPVANFSHFNVLLSFVVLYLCCRMTLSQTEHWAVDRVCFGRLWVVRVKQHKSCEPWATSGVVVGWPLKNRVGTSRRDIAQTYGRWEKKSPKSVASGTRASSLELAKLVIVVALPVLDGRNRWCNRMYNGAAVKDVCPGILLRTCLLSSAEDSPRCVIRVQAQIEF